MGETAGARAPVGPREEIDGGGGRVRNDPFDLGRGGYAAEIIPGRNTEILGNHTMKFAGKRAKPGWRGGGLCGCFRLRKRLSPELMTAE